MTQQIIQQGAEAIIYKAKDDVIKDRISKKYRHSELDNKLRRRRTKSEAKLLTKASAIINAPVPEIEDSDKLIMPFVDGKKLSEHLEKLDWKKVCKQIGQQIAVLHDNQIIHGDLTTSNMILTNSREVDSKKPLGVLHFIDFGLGFTSNRIEDRAVDLHLIKQALEAKHFSIHEQCWKIIQANYSSKDKKKVLDQLKKVESRGRYKKGC